MGVEVAGMLLQGRVNIQPFLKQIWGNIFACDGSMHRHIINIRVRINAVRYEIK